MKKKPTKSTESAKLALFELLKVHSFSQITVNDICKKAEIGRSTFYKSFYDKYDILEAENQDICQKIKSSLANLMTMANITTHLQELVEIVKSTRFLQMIEIEEGTVNLRKQILSLLEDQYIQYYNYKDIAIKWSISYDFAKELFCSAALAFIETSLNESDPIILEQNQFFLEKIMKQFTLYDE